MPPGRGGHRPRPAKGKPFIKKGGKKDAKPKNVPVSKRIRDVKRLLNKPDLDAAIRAAQEKKLAALEEELGERKLVARERKYAVRYHKIRFFERVKLERRQVQLLRRATDKGPALTAEEEAELQQVTEDLDYVKNFPKGEKYISILKTADTAEAQAHLEAERARLRALVKEQLAEAAMVTEADEGRSLAAKAVGGKTRAFAAAAASSDEEEGGAGGDEEEQDDFFLAESDEEEPAAPPRGKGAGGAGTSTSGEESEEEDGDESMGGSESEQEEEEESGEEMSSGSGDEDGAGAFAGETSSSEEEENSSDEDDAPRGGFRGGDRQGGGRGGGRGRFGSRDGGRGRGPGRGGGRGFSGGVEKRSGPSVFIPSLKPPQQPKKAPAKKDEKAPVRKRAEGGRKRRKKK